jgi:hypothetical protein
MLSSGRPGPAPGRSHQSGLAAPERSHPTGGFHLFFSLFISAARTPSSCRIVTGAVCTNTPPRLAPSRSGRVHLKINKCEIKAEL